MAKNLLFPDSILDLDQDGPPIVEGQRLNVLLLGIDARRGETMARTDSIILASVDPKSKQMSLLSIPRDTRVNIPKHGWDKINSATVYGGPQLSMKVVSELLGIPVKYYVLTNFSGFKDIVDALGGVTLDVEQNMYHEDETDGGIYEINLRKGVQRLDGDKALQYVRYRDYDLGDIDRTKYQQKFLVALAKEMLQPSTITRLPKLVPEINRYVKTNLSVGDLVTMSSAARHLGDGNIVCQTLPGRPLDINGGSYWGVDPAEARQMVTNLFNGETATSVVLNTPLTGQYVPPAESPKPEEPPPPTVAQQTQKPPLKQTLQGQNGTTRPTGAGQGAKQDLGGSDGSVNITPVDDDKDNDQDDENETTPGKTPKTGGKTSAPTTETKDQTLPSTGTVETDKTVDSEENETGAGELNPEVPSAATTGAWPIS